MTRQLRVTNARDGKPAELPVIGSVSFTKGLSQYMPDDVAESHKQMIEAIDANADVQMKEGDERPPFVQKFEVELIDPDAARVEKHAAFVVQAAQAAMTADVARQFGVSDDE